MNDWIGKSLGKVRIDSLLARGGMAEVYLGTHTTLKREVAVKIMRAQYEDDPDLLERFEREAQVVAKLRHQNIVQVFDFDSINDSPYIVMEYVPGPSLSQYLAVLHKNNLRVELSNVSKILTGVAHALQYAHDNGVIHRDIKPGNIILTSRIRRITAGETLPMDFVPILTDFGLVRFLNSSRQTSAGQTAGTPAYMSPEQARGETTDGRTDIYSLGIVLYEMLAGKVPFDGETTVSILLKHIADPLPPIRDLSASLQIVLDKALSKNPTERYPTPLKFANAFNAATEAKAEKSTFMGIAPVSSNVATSTVIDTDPSLIVIHTPPKPRRNWRLVVLGAIAVALFGVIYQLNGFASAPVTEIPTIPTITETIITSTQIPTIPPSAIKQDHTIILRFFDGDAIMDQAVLEALVIPIPAAGTHYEVWLAGPEGRINLGILIVDETGKGTRTYNASAAENLLSIYDQVEIVIKPDDAKSKEPEQIAYSYALPQDGLIYIRRLLVLNPDTPEQTSLIQALSADTELLDQIVGDMSKAHVNSAQTNVQKSAESILNILSGSKSLEHKDWNGDNQISDPGAGFGFLLNGNNLGHMRAVYAHADYVINSAGASQNMIIRSGEVKACAENLEQWILQLKEQAQNIVTANALTEMEAPVQEAAALIEKIRNGVDLNGNSIIEPIAGECGVVTTYESAYAMADMPLLPVNLLGTPTSGTPGTFISATPTKGSGGSGGSGGGSTPVPPTKPGGGGGNDKPTKTPKK